MRTPHTHACVHAHGGGGSSGGGGGDCYNAALALGLFPPTLPSLSRLCLLSGGAATLWSATSTAISASSTASPLMANLRANSWCHHGCVWHCLTRRLPGRHARQSARRTEQTRRAHQARSCMRARSARSEVSWALRARGRIMSMHLYSGQSSAVASYLSPSAIA